MRYKKKQQYLQQANKRIKEQDLPCDGRSSSEVKTIPLPFIGRSVCLYLLYPYLSIGYEVVTNWTVAL